MPKITLKEGTPFRFPEQNSRWGRKPRISVLQSSGLEDVTPRRAKEDPDHRHDPVLDAPVCHAETKRFNDEVANLPNAVVLVVSIESSPGQKRWC